MEHQPVLLQPVLEALDVQPDGIYIDATYGRGGHTSAILSRLSAGGRLYAFDQDPEAVAAASTRFADEPRFTIHHGSFQMLKTVCDQWRISGRTHGILFDLGVSSPQLDDPRRGFSFQQNGPLDMRMNNASGVPASQWLMTASEQEIADVLWRFGEERHARRIARAVIQKREQQPITTTGELVELIVGASPKTEKHKHPATRSFQAIRIFINRELDILQDALTQAVDVLGPKGRLAVISFHSLEDRIVKRFFREQVQGHELPRGLPVKEGHVGRTLKTVGKAYKPTVQEITENARARSAVLRVVEKLQ